MRFQIYYHSPNLFCSHHTQPSDLLFGGLLCKDNVILSVLCIPSLRKPCLQRLATFLLCFLLNRYRLIIFQFRAWTTWIPTWLFSQNSWMYILMGLNSIMGLIVACTLGNCIRTISSGDNGHLVNIHESCFFHLTSIFSDSFDTSSPRVLRLALDKLGTVNGDIFSRCFNVSLVWILGHSYIPDNCSAGILNHGFWVCHWPRLDASMKKIAHCQTHLALDG